jgi:AcrR family transcriptional regulator
VDWAAGRPPSAGLGPGTGAHSLRERKKALMRQRLTDTATQMFLARGFADVRVTEIAAACEVSEKTVYNYFPTKESLILDRWENTAQALRAALADPGIHPVDAVRHILAGELSALTTWLGAQRDPSAAIASVQRFSELITTTPALRAYHNDTMNELVTMTAGLLAGRTGRSADDPQPQIAAIALMGLWTVHATALRTHLNGASTPSGVSQAVTADVDAAAQVLRAGLGRYFGPTGG